MHDKGHHPEDLQLLPIVEMDGAIGRVARQQCYRRLKLQLIHREFAIDRGDLHAAMARFAAAVHYQQVTIMDPVIHHAVTGRSNEVGFRRVRDAELVQVDGLLHVVLGGGREATGDRNSGSSRLSGDGCGIASMVVALAVFLYSMARVLAVRIRCQLGCTSVDSGASSVN